MLGRRLRRWVQAGLLEQAAAERIAAYEASRRKPALLYGLGGLGAATIGIGLISIVASNWGGIGAPAKLLSDLALGAGLAWATWRSVVRRSGWQSEVLVLVLYLFSLASLGLVGQIYQTGTPLSVAFTTWTLCTLPLVFLGRSVLLGVVFYAGFSTTLVLDCIEAVEALDTHLQLRGNTVENIALALAWALPVGLLALSATPPLARWRPTFGTVFRGLTLTAMVFAAFAAQFLWYKSLLDWQELKYGFVAAAGVVAVCWLASPHLFPGPAHRIWAALMTFALISLSASSGFHREALPWVGASGQIVVLILLGLVAVRSHAFRIFHIVTGLIALRVLIAYFEVFGSMMSTGLAMVTGGLLTLGLAWVWKRKSSTLAGLLDTEGETS